MGFMQGAVATAEAVFSTQRRAMVDCQIRTFDVTDQTVIQAFSAVPREAFLPSSLRDLAYSDAVLTLPGASQRVMVQPMHLARMIQSASIRPADRVMVVAGGTGYAAAVVAHLANLVVSLDCEEGMTAQARSAAASLDLLNMEAATGALAKGHAARAPYDVILVQGTVETNLATLFDQLSPTGCLIALQAKLGQPSHRTGKAIRFQRIGTDISERFLFDATAPIISDFRGDDKFVF